MSTLDTLLSRVLESPNDTSARLVLADAWLEAGNPRGELVHVQHKLASGADSGALRQRAEELVRTISQSILGAPSSLELEWDLGFLDRVRVPLGEQGAEADMEKVLASDDAKLLRSLVLDVPEEESSNDRLRTFLEKKRTTPPRLSELVLGAAFARSKHDRVFSYYDFSFSDDVSRALEAFPRIEALRVDLGAAEITVGALKSTSLKSFEWIAPYVPTAWLEPLGASELPALERFVLSTGAQWMCNTEEDLDDGDADYDEVITEGDLEGIFAMLDRAPKLRELGVHAFYGDLAALMAALAAHGFFSRLHTLDISKGHLLDEESAQAIVRGAERAPELVRLVANDTSIEDDARAILSERFELASNGPPDAGQFRYVVTME